MSLIHAQTFLWTPKVKDRPRAQPGGKGRSFTPKATKEAEKSILDQYVGPLVECPIGVEVDFFNDRIVFSMWEMDDYTERKLRGDVDNYLKLVTDALNGQAYADDRQIVRLEGRKN